VAERTHRSPTLALAVRVEGANVTRDPKSKSSLELARKRWGRAFVIKGEGHPSLRPPTVPSPPPPAIFPRLPAA